MTYNNQFSYFISIFSKQDHLHKQTRRFFIIFVVPFRKSTILLIFLISQLYFIYLFDALISKFLLKLLGKKSFLYALRIGWRLFGNKNNKQMI